ncbi:MAG: RluA family pseudouridine synthase [Nanobdellota archaeon]
MRYRINSYTVTSSSQLSDFLLSSCSFLKSSDVSRRWISHSLVTVNGSVCLDVSRQLVSGDVVSLHTPESFEPSVSKTYSVLFDDDSLLVIDKPAPLPVHPAGPYWFHTLTSILQDDGLLGKTAYPLYRLDKETSGVIVFAKNSCTARELQRQLIEGTVCKEYVGVCLGVPKKSSFQISKPLKKTSRGNIRDVMVVDPAGKPSTTTVSLLACALDNSWSLLSFVPKTGRRHQIRAHLFYSGHPVLGDVLYSHQRAVYPSLVDRPFVQSKPLVSRLIPRHLLHCKSFSLTHPCSGRRLTFYSPLHSDICSFIFSKKV